MKIFIIILLLSSFYCRAQTKEDLNLFISTTEISKRPYYLDIANRGKGIIGKTSTSLFIFYKTFISSQDMASCSFYPSCSEYALLSFRTQKFFSALMNMFDRLTRCHPFTPENYIIDTHLHLQIDPPKNAHYYDLR